METEIESENPNLKGKPISCKNCNHKFRLDKVAKEEWKISKFKCPNCQEKYCNMPKTEKVLHELQESILQNRNSKDIVEMYEILKRYVSSLILKHYGTFIKDKDVLDYHCHSSAVKLVENYSKPNFFIEYSFGGYIIWKIRESIFSKHEIDCAENSLDFTNYNNFLFDCSLLSSIQDNIHKEESVDNVYQYLLSLIYGKPNRQISMKLAICFLNFVIDGEKGSDRIFLNFDTEGKNVFNNLKTTFKNKLLEIVRNDR